MPNSFEDRGSRSIKEQLLTFAGRDLAYRMREAGKLSPEEEWHVSYLYAIAASPQPRRREFANIYDLVLYGLLRGFERADAGWLYRGHWDAGRDLIPSFYRTRPDLLRPEGAAVRDQVARVLHSLVEEGRMYAAPFALEARILDAWRVERLPKLDALRDQPTFPLLASLSEFQQDAVIQHYCSGTPFLDFTKSICVAAFFATDRSSRQGKRPPTKGAIYVVHPNDLERELALGTVVSIEVPECFERPRRQKAVFVLTTWPELLRDRVLFDVWTFHHTDVGLDFECGEYGISRALLLPDSSGLESACRGQR